MVAGDSALPQARWSPCELGEFIEHVRDDRFFALWMLVATTGIRVDTLTDLRREDVDLQHARLSLRPRAASGRRDATLSVARNFALDPDAHQALRDHAITWDKASTGQRSDRIFVWANGEPIHPKSVEVLFRWHCQKAGLPNVPLQAMRQAYVVAALESGIPTAVISERLGRSVIPSALGRVPNVGSPQQPVRSTSTGPTERHKRTGRSRSCHLRSC